MRIEGSCCSHCSLRMAQTVAPRYAAAAATPSRRGAGAAGTGIFLVGGISPRQTGARISHFVGYAGLDRRPQVVR